MQSAKVLKYLAVLALDQLDFLACHITMMIEYFVQR